MILVIVMALPNRASSVAQHFVNDAMFNFSVSLLSDGPPEARVIFSLGNTSRLDQSRVPVVVLVGSINSDQGERDVLACLFLNSILAYPDLADNRRDLRHHLVWSTSW